MDKNVFYILLVALLLAIGIIYIENNHSMQPSPNYSSILTPSPSPAINLLPSASTNTSSITPQQSLNQQSPNPTSTNPTNPTPTPKSLNDIQGIATIETSKGNIVIQLDKTDAPYTVVNFVNKALNGFYNGLSFHRVEDWVIQGGDPKGDGTGGNNNLSVELNNKPFVVGSLGQASLGDGKTQNDSQFFIVKQEADWLNGKYTNYGIVTSGMDVVNNIAIGDKIIGISIQ